MLVVALWLYSVLSSWKWLLREMSQRGGSHLIIWLKGKKTATQKCINEILNEKFYHSLLEEARCIVYADVDFPGGSGEVDLDVRAAGESGVPVLIII